MGSRRKVFADPARPRRISRRTFLWRAVVVTGGTLVALDRLGRMGPGGVLALDAIDPTTEPVGLRIFVPGSVVERVYPPADDFMPVEGFDPTFEGWAISSAEKARTGIQAFDIKRTADPGRYTFNFVDTRAGLAPGDYSVVGVADETLVERHGKWTLP